ncbi:MAG: hypothetical protein KGJ23_08005 [Euryarchaeota archaeon]|nr:hypothetical protein [Euryarchaeota archaeon]MDE1836544.1 hypothetical protein [Euryarchaeota archaeon]MDE1879261.1 hypothetical protein [Euryarchaeota archaeon]MDE2044514.1 hypothetical protein [Thermoplasmata archaeon]
MPPRKLDETDLRALGELLSEFGGIASVVSPVKGGGVTQLCITIPIQESAPFAVERVKLAADLMVKMNRARLDVIRCPSGPHKIPGCSSENVVGPDEEGFYDCLNCGLFFKETEAGTETLTEEHRNGKATP